MDRAPEATRPSLPGGPVVGARPPDLGDARGEGGGVKPSRKWWVLVTAVALACGGAALWGEWARRHPDPMELGLAAYDRGDYKAANERARARLRTFHDDPKALRLLARSAARLGRHQAAAPIYRRLGPPALEAEDEYLVGMGLEQIGRADEALASWESARKRDPSHAETLRALTEAYARHGRFEKAAEAAARLARMPRQEALGELMLGVIRADMNDPDGAAGHLGRALRLDPSPRGGDPSRFRKLLAKSLLRVGRPAEARAQLEAIPGYRADPELSWLLSRALLAEGSASEASASLDRAGPYRDDRPLEPEPAPFVGSSKCIECHRGVCESESHSRHARSLFRADALSDLPLPGRPLPDPGDPAVTHAYEREGDRIVAKTTLDGRLYRVLVEYAFGTPDRYVTMVGRDEQGTARAVRLSRFRSDGGEGWDLTSGDEPRPPRRGDYLGKPIDTLEGAVRCLACHASNVRAGRDRVGPETADAGIGCEKCHGPGGNHLAAVAAHWPDPAIVSPSLASGGVIQKLCGECHSLNEPLVEATAPRDDPAWIRSQATTLGWSRCYSRSEGALSCLTCHAAHRPAESSPAYYEAKCLSCHPPSPGRDGPPSESKVSARKPCPVSPAKGCLGCHMPAVESKSLHTKLTDHNIRVRRAPPAGG